MMDRKSSVQNVDTEIYHLSKNNEYCHFQRNQRDRLYVLIKELKTRPHHTARTKVVLDN